MNRFALSLLLSAMTLLAAGQANPEPYQIAFLAAPPIYSAVEWPM
jgi:hypothetical protein